MKTLKFLCCLIGLVMMGSCALEPKVPDGEFLIEGRLKFPFHSSFCLDCFWY